MNRTSAKPTALPSRRALLAASAGMVTAPSIARGAGARRWRMATSWSRNLPGPGVSARRLAERITAMSERALTIEVFAAGEIVPALQVFDAVSAGTVEMAHTAALFWGGKMPVSPVFTTVPFGLDAHAHMAWLDGGAQALWDELYAPHGVKALVAGNTGPSAAGWFRREIRTPDDLKGLRIRATGLGGEVLTSMGATAMAIAPADTYAALERGVIDAVELLAPANDLPLGMHRIAPFCLLPGFNKPNGPSELLIGLPLWTALPEHLKAIVTAACRAEHDMALAEAQAANARAIGQLAAAGVTFAWLGADVLGAAKVATAKVIDRIVASGPLAGRIVASLDAHARAGSTWRRMSAAAQAQLG